MEEEDFFKEFIDKLEKEYRKDKVMDNIIAIGLVICCVIAGAFAYYFFGGF